MKFMDCIVTGAGRHSSLSYVYSEHAIGWQSECRKYLITLLDGSKDPDYVKHCDYDYVQPCLLRKDGGLKMRIAKVACNRDGSAAFVVKEMMDLYSNHADGFEEALVGSIRDFAWIMDASGEWGSLPGEWKRADVRAFHAYKEKWRAGV